MSADFLASPCVAARRSPRIARRRVQRRVHFADGRGCGGPLLADSEARPSACGWHCAWHPERQALSPGAGPTNGTTLMRWRAPGSNQRHRDFQMPEALSVGPVGLEYWAIPELGLCFCRRLERRVFCAPIAPPMC